MDLETAHIVVAPSSPDLERFAASELERYLMMLFGRNIPITDGVPDGEGPLVLIGSPATNPAMAELGVSHRWPSTSEQSIVLKDLAGHGRPVYLVGGGSPQATLWAVYELVERFGVRYLLSGDVFPDPPGTFALPELDEHIQPVFPDRIWRLMNDEPHGPEMWSLDENRRVLDQLAKLKVSGIYLSTYPSHPFVHYEFRGVQKSTATLNYGLKYPIDNDCIGREQFGDVTEFINPEFRHCRTYEEWIETGQHFAHAVFAHAKSRGMRVGIGFSLTDVPQEFKEHFHEWSPATDDRRGERGKTDFARLGVVTVGTPPQNRSFQDVDNPVLLELSELLVKTHLDTYPELDFVLVGSAEFRNSVTGYERCWAHLDEKYHIESIAPLDGILHSAHARYYHGEGRAERELKADIEFLYFVDKLFVEHRLLERLGRPELPVMMWEITRELYPVLDRTLPSNFGPTCLIDYNMSLALPQIEALAPLKDAEIDHYVTISIQDDMQSLLVSSEGARIEKFLEAMRRYGFGGWTSRYWSIGDLDHSTLYLARASWDGSLTLAKAYDDYIRTLCGEACLPEMREALRLLEDNSATQDVDLFAVGFPYPSLMRGHFEMARHFAGAQQEREQLLECRDNYVRASQLIRAALGKARPEARGRLEYLIGRLTTCALFLETAYTVERAGFAYRAAQEAREARDPDALTRSMNRAAELLKRSVDLARRCAQAQADNIRDESDLGLLAAMNQYMYKYLKARSFLVSHEASAWHL